MPTRTMIVTLLAAAVVVLAGCSAQTSRRPDAPKNLLGQEVDPIYGTPVPGTPTINGGRD
jgi:outer membrane biogenesis lipoprotein LolB